jgi:hypothetical protein
LLLSAAVQCAYLDLFSRTTSISSLPRCLHYSRSFPLFLYLATCAIVPTSVTPNYQLEIPASSGNQQDPSISLNSCFAVLQVQANGAMHKLVPFISTVESQSKSRRRRKRKLQLEQQSSGRVSVTTHLVEVEAVGPSRREILL